MILESIRRDACCVRARACPSPSDELIGHRAMVAAGLVGGDVASLPRAVEEVGHLARPRAGVPQSEGATCVSLVGMPRLGRGALCKHFPELPQLE